MYGKTKTGRVEFPSGALSVDMILYTRPEPHEIGAPSISISPSPNVQSLTPF